MFLLVEGEVKTVQSNIKYALLERCTIEKVQGKISDFSKRYTHYQINGQKNIWAFSVVSEKYGELVCQFVDKTFEPPRGRGRSDQPYICVKLTQVGDNVKIAYWLEWKKWKLPLVVSGSIMYFVFLGLGSSMSTLEYKEILVIIGLYIYGLCIFLTWIIQNIRHDRLTLKVFRDLLDKNYTDIKYI